MEAPRAIAPVDNDWYNDLGQSWLTAWDSPIAILRVEAYAKIKWILKQLAHFDKNKTRILDMGCGAGIISNALASAGYNVTGIDLSTPSLEIAKTHDQTQKARYLQQNALDYNSSLGHFDVVLCLDLLEHVEKPSDLIGVAQKYLKPQGFFIYHTINRNILANFLGSWAIKKFVKNTPAHFHESRLFIKPTEVLRLLELHQLRHLSFCGLRPQFSVQGLLSLLFTGVVPRDMTFVETRSLLITYMGIAQL